MRSCLLLISVVLFLCTSAASAEPSVLSELGLDELYEQRVDLADISEGDPVVRLSKKSKISIQSRRFGNFKLTLTHAMPKTWDAYVVTDSGWVTDPDVPLLTQGNLQVFRRSTQFSQGEIPVALSIIGKRSKRLRLSFLAENRRGKKFVYTVTARFQKDSERNGTSKLRARVRRKPVNIFKNHECGTVAPESQEGSDTAFAPTSLQTATISTEADSDWYATHGGSSNSAIASIINEVNSIWDDVSIRFSIKEQVVRSSVGSDPYQCSGCSDAGTLIAFFRSYTNTNRQLGSADLYHLFTGRDLDGGTVGIAYLGVACVSQSASYGVSQHLSSSYNHLVTAHELGHNFNAQHTSAGLMYYSLSLSNNYFSETSQNEINAHVASLGGSSCLSSTGGGSTETPTPTPSSSPTPTPSGTPSPTTTPSPSPSGGSPGGGSGGGSEDDPREEVEISIAKRKIDKRSFQLDYLAVGNVSGTPIANQTLQLLMSKRWKTVATTLTDEEGRGSILVRRKRKAKLYRLQVNIPDGGEIEDGEFLSNKVKIPRRKK